MRSVIAPPRIGAIELAAALGQPSPTPQQRTVIEAPLSPALVVAGAGSGKTETMASRVVWLLANGQVTPGQVLGLTFTRKAAGGLAERISGRIAALRAKGLLADDDKVARASGQDAAIVQKSTAIFDQPTVSTYNAFANALFRDNALLVGREPESVLLSDATAWGLARRIVIRHGDERLVRFDKSVDTVTEAVLALSHELSENVVDPAEIPGFVDRFVRLGDLPYTSGRPKSSGYASVAKAMETVGALTPLVDLAVRFSEEKRVQGLVEFSDQVALALAVVDTAPGVGDQYRNRYRVVLLDEYQDTSVVQTRLLKTLFSGHGVMAVGDPNQSIYGWRGASAANLRRFAADFAGGAAATFQLSVSWRNATSILAAANTLVRPLRSAVYDAAKPLEPRPTAPEGTVRLAYPETIDQEAEAVAEWFAGELAARTTGQGMPSAAILFRARAPMDLFAQALERRGIPHHVLGLGGLLSAPEIVDLVSTLRVVHDPSAGSALIRLLAGARWRVGVRDLGALRKLAGWLAQTTWAQSPLSDEVKARLRESVSTDDGASIVDALDFLTQAPPSHGKLAPFTQAGLDRLRDAGRTLSFFRSRVGGGLSDLVRVIEQELRLDIEVVANESSGAARSAQANLYAFQDELIGFLASDSQATLGSFLGWLDRAAKQDTMGPRSDSAEEGVVQLLTIHGAKGLEWDIVAVPRLVADELPAKSREGTGWVRFGGLPYEFRGDAAELPALRWQQAETQQEFDQEHTRFKGQLASRQQDEERRLGYVAVTRARDALLVTGSFWTGTVKSSRAPSVFLTELADAGLIPQLPEASEFEENPRSGADVTLNWPMDPLGARRSRVEAAAAAVQNAAVQNAAVHDAGGCQAEAGLWQNDIELLLAERARRAAEEGLVALPTRIPASRFKDYVSDPASVAQGLRRPMPHKPYRQTRLGTVFHSWVEQRYAVSGAPGDLIDAALTELDVDSNEVVVDRDELAALQTTFEHSRWASLAPEFVEIEIHLALADRIVVCKLDAVYRLEAHDDEFDYQIVDWKTGKAPKDTEDLQRKQLQLALYRLAFAKWRGIAPERIDAVFYFVSDDQVIRPERIYSEEELVSLWSSATGLSPLE